MNKVQRRKLKRSANLRLLFFTFFGAFILFFLAFTYILPIVTPRVEIPALTEDRVFDSITSHDFRGRIDPRLRTIELQAEIPAKKEKETPAPEKTNNQKNENKIAKKETDSAPIPGSHKKLQDKNKEQKTTVKPPRPKPLTVKEKVSVAPPVPVFRAKVVVGNFNSPDEAKMTSKILASLNYKPFIRERNGKYILQVGSFAEPEKAEDFVEELEERNFDAKIIYE